MKDTSRHWELETYGLEDASLGFNVDFLVSPIFAQGFPAVVFLFEKVGCEVGVVGDL